MHRRTTVEFDSCGEDTMQIEHESQAGVQRTGQKSLHDDLAAHVVPQYRSIRAHEQVHRLQHINVHLQRPPQKKEGKRRRHKRQAGTSTAMAQTKGATEVNRNAARHTRTLDLPYLIHRLLSYAFVCVAERSLFDRGASCGGWKIW